jgi:hypothetical protein
LTATISKTFPAAKLVILFKSSPIWISRLKDNLPTSSSSFCIYSLTCDCQAKYVERTTRRLSDRIREHMPRWLCNGTKKPISSAIGSHFIDTGHRIPTTEEFSIVYQAPRMKSRVVRTRLLATAEAIAIRIADPSLCAQKQFVLSLQLLWPNKHVPYTPTVTNDLEINSIHVQTNDNVTHTYIHTHTSNNNDLTHGQLLTQ